MEKTKVAEVSIFSDEYASINSYPSIAIDHPILWVVHYALSMS